jgi:cell division protein ZapA (FtsZ GTPase activity inhibitor)
MDQVRVVTVEIGGHRFPIRSTLEQNYVSELAAYVDGKMRAASEAAPAADGVGLAVLVALNLADELFRCRERQSSASGDLNERALRLEQLVDTVLAQPSPRLRSSM